MSTNFVPTQAEIALTNAIFAQADPKGLGAITGDVAVRIFAGAKLSPTVLGEIWDIADEDGKGRLSKRGVNIAVRLMGHAQAGTAVTPSLIGQPGPLPNIEGIVVPILRNSTGGTSSTKSPPPSLPVLTSQDKAKFQSMFDTGKPVNGLLNGDKARELFVKSRLPVATLGQIWSLADTQDRGALDSTDFAIAMYLIQNTMSGRLSFIPSSLPPGLYEQARGGSKTSSNIVTSPPPPVPARTAIQPQYTGSRQPVQAVPTGQSNLAPRLPVRPSQTNTATASPFRPPQNVAWDVTAEAKATADRFFDTLDTDGKGYITGDVAGPFMLQSQLDAETLAKVWDLSDIYDDGKLTRDSFAVVMHLINGKLAGKDIPAVLPPSLVPPSMRPQANTIGRASVFVPPPEPQADLLWGDDFPTSPAAPPVPSPVKDQPTGGARSVLSPSYGNARLPNQDPFTSGFGPSSSKNFLDDDDDHGTTSPPLHDQSADIGNATNQLKSTNRSLDAAKVERESAEKTLTSQASQLSALQIQLSSAKAAYETETLLLTTLRERLTVQTADIKLTREQLITAESDLSAIRVEKTEVGGALLRDKDEARELQRKIIEVGAQVESLKADVEKIKKEAKQQKGLLAIARKQLSTKEAERVKLARELELASQELASVVREKEEAETELSKELPPSADHDFAGIGGSTASVVATRVVTGTPDTGTPARAATPAGPKSNNPFELLARSASSSPAPVPAPSSPFMTLGDAFSPASPDPAKDAVGSPVTKPATQEEPFGFFQAFEVDKAPSTTKALSTTAAEIETALAKSRVSEDSVEPAATLPRHEEPTSRDDAGKEHSAPQPSTTNGPQLTRSATINAAFNKYPDLDTVDAQFPSLENQFDADRHAESESQGPLREIEPTDSDTDSDSDDDVPLAEAQAAIKGQAAASLQAAPLAPTTETTRPEKPFDDTFTAPPEAATPKPQALTPKPQALTPKPQALSPKAPAPATPAKQIPEPNFDEAFGFTAEKSSSPFESVPAPQPPVTVSAPTPSPAPVVAGVNAFDEAMSKISGTSGVPSILPHFSFDTSFDDNFDFSSVSGSSATTFSPAPSAVNGKASDGGFNDAFGLPTVNAGTAISHVAPSPAPVSFNDAFGVNTSTVAPVRAASPPKEPAQRVSFGENAGGRPFLQTLKLDESHSPSPHSEVTTVPNSPVAAKNGHPPSRRREARSLSPPLRSGTPPTQHSNPISPRPSTSSGKEAPPDKHKDGGRSKLSIRLPFGRKKKEPHPTPPPPVLLRSPVEDVSEGRPLSPPVADDIAPVKQLCGMGFSRSVAVAALEQHGFDVQRALNSLLGSQ